MLEQLLEEINFQRTKEMRQLLKDGECRRRACELLCPRGEYYRADGKIARVCARACVRVGEVFSFIWYARVGFRLIRRVCFVS